MWLLLSFKTYYRYRCASFEIDRGGDSLEGERTLNMSPSTVRTHSLIVVRIYMFY